MSSPAHPHFIHFPKSPSAHATLTRWEHGGDHFRVLQYVNDAALECLADGALQITVGGRDGGRGKRSQWVAVLCHTVHKAS